MNDASRLSNVAGKAMREAAQARQLHKLLDENTKALHVNSKLLNDRSDLAAENSALGAENARLNVAVAERNQAIWDLIDLVLRANRLGEAGVRFTLMADEGDIVHKAHHLTKPPHKDPDED